MKRNTIHQGDALEVMRGWPDSLVQCVVTSPPYWGLRDYQVDGQLGLETTPDAYLARMVELFREVRRVLRDDGCLWLNMGDSYAAGTNDGKSFRRDKAEVNLIGRRPPPGLKPKDLCGMPWRLALALQADGWWLRSDIIWAKPNPMPESCRDRPTKSHEYIFLLTKSGGYFWDQEAVKEESVDPVGSAARYKSAFTGRPGLIMPDGKEQQIAPKGMRDFSGRRNIRTVWTIPTQAMDIELCRLCKRTFTGREYRRLAKTKDGKWRICTCGEVDWVGHFATFPEKIVEPCVKAGSSERGACPECGKAWERVVQSTSVIDARPMTTGAAKKAALGDMARTTPQGRTCGSQASKTLGSRPGCACGHEETRPCLVLDPFMGSGTVAVVAERLGRAYLGIELNPDYIIIAKRRLAEARGPMFADMAGTRESAGE